MNPHGWPIQSDFYETGMVLATDISWELESNSFIDKGWDEKEMKLRESGGAKIENEMNRESSAS